MFKYKYNQENISQDSFAYNFQGIEKWLISGSIYIPGVNGYNLSQVNTLAK